ncbi:hypothetical protein TrLO_g7695 [Triparma laevis f. longispina]|uniref:Uncharacterized protein n=1 Tax=Triparma laevis f. longispina TaxID=1714387 RepID=A0A9W6ZQA9_9STRA|nr:hypothetical protein TrLO_g7695 [Triparma laevis f. longispina]
MLNSSLVTVAGFTGKSDWVISDDCSIDILAVRVLWCFLVLLCCVNVKWVCALWVSLYKSAAGDLKKMYTKNVPILCTLILFWLVSLIIPGLLKIIDPVKNQIEPISLPGIFLIFGLGGPCFYWATIIVTNMQLKLALKGMGSKDETAKNLEIVADKMTMKGYLDTFFILLGVALGLIGGVGEDKTLSLVGYMIFNGWRSFTMIVALLQTKAMEAAVNKAFDGVEPKEGVEPDAQTKKILDLKNTMADMSKQAGKAAILNGSGMAIFAFYIPWAKYWTYWTPAQMILANGLILKSSEMFKPDKKTGKAKVTPSAAVKSTVVTSSE